ncbi:MAG TPA: hypothetical protein VFK43_21880 [Acidimicrobiales bacterium]|nr:hypothetical protein [Acidimicrobiales bacterium]
MALVGLAACGGGGSDETADPAPAAAVRTYVGSAQGTAAFVAVVFDGSRVLAYVCDGVPGEPAGTAPTIQAWFNTSSDGASVNATQPAGQLQLRLTETEMSGTLTLTGGRALPVTGRTAAGDAGLYRAEATGASAKAVAGWILTADGQQRGGVGGEGSLPKLSGARVLNLAQPTFTAQGLATARIAKVGITPIPIP